MAWIYQALGKERKDLSSIHCNLIQKMESFLKVLIAILSFIGTGILYCVLNFFVEGIFNLLYNLCCCNFGANGEDRDGGVAAADTAV